MLNLLKNGLQMRSGINYVPITTLDKHSRKLLSTPTNSESCSLGAVRPGMYTNHACESLAIINLLQLVFRLTLDKVTHSMANHMLHHQFKQK